MAGISTPYADFFCGFLMLVGGVLLFIYRNEIGNFTDYYTGRGGYVDKPTPGCLLIPFALALVAGGVIIILKSAG
ncbi:MAG: hypothetical protein C0402_06960 [Thermodesulfovibrio sp.]|nr:hypothetical protein [Thermodesulfovibrio sp.]